VRYLFILLLLMNIVSFGQTGRDTTSVLTPISKFITTRGKDTLEFLLDYEKKLSKPERASYYRLAYKEDAYWRVKDFDLIAKTIEMNGLYTNDSFTTPHGMHYWYHSNGKLQKKGRYIDGLKEGIWKQYGEDGRLVDSSLYKNGLPWKFAYNWFADGKISFRGIYDDNGKGSGYETGYLEDGTLSSFGKYADGYKRDSIWTYYYKNDRPCSIEYYSNGRFLKSECFGENGDPEKCDIDTDMIKLMESSNVKSPDIEHRYVIAEKMPEPPFDVTRFLSQNIRYPEKARDKNIQGRVAVQFVVDEDGNITDIKVPNHNELAAELEDEAARVVSIMPKWRPGRQHHKPVKVYYTLPVVFSLN
jgi:TonB family protein